MNSDTKIYETLLALDGLDPKRFSLDCALANSLTKCKCTRFTGRFFENTAGRIYQACATHLPVYLRYRRGGPEGGGWKEIIL